MQGQLAQVDKGMLVCAGHIEAVKLYHAVTHEGESWQGCFCDKFGVARVSEVDAFEAVLEKGKGEDGGGLSNPEEGGKLDVESFAGRPEGEKGLKVKLGKAREGNEEGQKSLQAGEEEGEKGGFRHLPQEIVERLQ